MQDVLTTATVLPFTRADIEQTIPARFAQVVRSVPDHVALTGKGRQWTYRQLDARANGIAHAVQTHARAGSGCVAYLIDHSPEMVIATLAILTLSDLTTWTGISSRVIVPVAIALPG